MAILGVIFFIAGAIVVAAFYAVGFAVRWLWTSDFGGVLLSWHILGRGVAGALCVFVGSV